MKIELNKADLTKINVLLSGVKNGAPRVISRAINKTSTGVVATAAKEIGKHYNLTQKRIKQDFKKQFATVANPRGAVIATGEPVSLTTFSGTRQVAKGVSAMVLKDKPRFTLKHAFIATAKGSKQVFWREYKGPRSTTLYKKWKRSGKYATLPEEYRYQIHIRKGPRIEDEYAKPRTQKAVIDYTDDRFKTVLDQELNFELSKL